MIRHPLAARRLDARVTMAIVRLSSHEGTLPLIDREVLDTLGRVLDNGPRRDTTIAAINEFNVAVLSRTWRRLAIDNVACATLGNDECRVLDSLEELRHDPCAPDGLLLEDLMELEWQHRFRRAALVVVGATAQRMPPAGTAPWPVVPAHGDAPRPPVQEIEALELSEAITLFMVRLWVRGIGMDFHGPTAVRLLGNHLAEPVMAEVVCALLGHTAQAIRRRFDVRCFCCPELSPDEAHVLDAIAALGDGRPTDYGKCLLAWLPEERAQRLVTQTCVASQPLSASQARLPWRHWDIATLVARQPLFDPPASGARHTFH